MAFRVILPILFLLAAGCGSPPPTPIATSTPFPTAMPTPFPTAMPTLTVYEASVIEDGCDAADKMLRILEGGIGREEEFSEEVLERGMMRLIRDYDSNEDALHAQMTAMTEAMLVSEQYHGYSSKLMGQGRFVGVMLKNWTNTMGIYDYRNVLDSLEDFLGTCSEMVGSQ